MSVFEFIPVDGSYPPDAEEWEHPVAVQFLDLHGHVVITHEARPKVRDGMMVVDMEISDVLMRHENIDRLRAFDRHDQEIDAARIFKYYDHATFSYHFTVKIGPA